MTWTNSDYDLDYLFVAELANGQCIKQDPTDKAKYSEWGSAFTDVVQSSVPVVKFSLLGKGHIFTIDLVDGHFEADGNKLYPPTEIPYGASLRLIYYRQVNRSLELGEDGNLRPPKIKYFIGWQYTHEGKNKKWEIGLE